MHPTLYPILSDFRWDWTLTFIHNVFVFLGGDGREDGRRGERKKERDPNLTRQLCLGKETIYQKWGVIYAILSVLTPNSGCAVSSATRSHLQLFSEIHHGLQDRYAALRGPPQLVHQQLGRPLRHSRVFASSLLFGKDRTAWTNMGTLMNGVCHCEWERLGGKVFKGTMWILGQKKKKKKMAGRKGEKWGWSDVKQNCGQPFGKCY